MEYNSNQVIDFAESYHDFYAIFDTIKIVVDNERFEIRLKNLLKKDLELIITLLDLKYSGLIESSKLQKEIEKYKLILDKPTN